MRFLILLILLFIISGCATEPMGITPEACREYVKQMTLAGTLDNYQFGSEPVGLECENMIFEAQQNLPEVK
jgi:hypothetical protein